MAVDLNNDGDGMSNIDIIKHAKRLKLKNFSCRMRDEFKKLVPKDNECGVINLNSIKEPGSHWSCYWKSGDDKYYFDSFGVVPPKEPISYLKSPILYSTFQIQQFNDTNCGEWCLYVLDKLNRGEEFINIILNIIEHYKVY